MSAAPLPPTADVPDAPSRGAQVALSIFLVVLLGLLAFRGYGNKFTARPTDPTAPDLTDLNTAGPSELAQVPGIGPKAATAIVDHRRVHGPFKSVEELKSVRGFGPMTFEKVRPHVRAGAVPTSTSEPPTAPGEYTSTSFSSPIAHAPAPTPVPAQLLTQSAKPAPAGSKKMQPGDSPIDVNTAPPDELQRLPGVGPVTARAIVAARTATPFQTVNDLDKVKGIGPKTLDKLRPFVVVR